MPFTDLPGLAGGSQYVHPTNLELARAGRMHLPTSKQQCSSTDTLAKKCFKVSTSS